MGVRDPSSAPARRPHLAGILGLVAIVAALLATPAGMTGASPDADAVASPGAPLMLEPRVHLGVEPMLGGLARPGRWVGLRIRTENDGPVVDGELRITTLEQRPVRTSVPIELPTGARQEHVVPVRLPVFGRLRVELMAGGSVRARVDTQVLPMDDAALGVGIVAERPERLVDAVEATWQDRGGPATRLATMTPADLPSTAQAWRSMDLLVWQDTPAVELSQEQLAALGAWVADGGSLVLLGGSMGATGLEGLPDALLPYRPASVVDVPSEALAGLLGGLPGSVPDVTALAGPDGPGIALGRVGGQSIAATRAVGRGRVILIGIDPAAGPVRGSAIAAALWDVALPTGITPGRIGSSGDDRSLASALSALPTVAVPRQDHLVVLLVLYLLLLGPISYLVLKRFDRLAWAWVTTPVLIALFVVAAYVLGVVLKGTTVVVRELAVVPGAVGSLRALAEVQVSVFSPNRATFDVRVPGDALLSFPTPGRRTPGVDPFVVLVSPGRVRGLRVDSGSTTTVRAEATVDVPEITADLSLVEGMLQGTITNRSGSPLEDVVVLHGGGILALGDLAAGERRPVELATAGKAPDRRALRRRLFLDRPAADASDAVTHAARLALLRHAMQPKGWRGGGPDAVGADSAVILAWRSEAPLEVDLGTPIRTAGETLYLLSAPVDVRGPVAFTGTSMRPRLIDATAATALVRSTGSRMDQGTVTVALRPSGLTGSFAVTDLRLRLAPVRGVTGADALDLEPLPDAAQPDQADPVGSGDPAPPPAEAASVLPRIQLRDRGTGRWTEFPPLDSATTYRIPEPDRYVDATGSLVVRFVLRTPDEEARFVLEPRVEGIVS